MAAGDVVCVVAVWCFLLLVLLLVLFFVAVGAELAVVVAGIDVAVTGADAVAVGNWAVRTCTYFYILYRPFDSFW